MSAAVLTKAAISPFLCNASNADFIRHKLSLQIKILLLRPFFHCTLFFWEVAFLRSASSTLCLPSPSRRTIAVTDLYKTDVPLNITQRGKEETKKNTRPSINRANKKSPPNTEKKENLVHALYPSVDRERPHPQKKKRKSYVGRCIGYTARERDACT